MNIDWLASLIVFGVALGAAVVIVGLYSLGIRFLATPAPKRRLADGTFELDGPSRDDEEDDVDSVGRPGWATVGAYVCFGVSALVVVAGIVLIVPALNFWA